MLFYRVNCFGIRKFFRNKNKKDFFSYRLKYYISDLIEGLILLKVKKVIIPMR